VDAVLIDADRPEQPARRDAGIEVVDLVCECGIDRSLEDVYSNEAERSVVQPAVEADISAAHESYVGVKGTVGVAICADAGDVRDSDDSIEIGNRGRIARSRQEQVKHLGTRAERLNAAWDRPWRGAPAVVMPIVTRECRSGPEGGSGRDAACDDDAPLNHPPAGQNVVVRVAHREVSGNDCGKGPGHGHGDHPLE
jgi:hypothetical protein